ncbi:MAG: hypothetical protein WCJ41_10155 [Aestuariivirga sp.]|uniref:hypothetical protein n=1 Tax=Aestuariivirga sp. TaxID=2650926 RepID=UPI003018956D
MNNPAFSTNRACGFEAAAVWSMERHSEGALFNRQGAHALVNYSVSPILIFQSLMYKSRNR